MLLAILGACDVDARAIISQAETSQQAWNQLCTTFANKSRSWVLFLKGKMSSISKGQSSVYDYLMSIKIISDELSLIGYPLDDIDLVLYYLSCLGSDFKDIATVLRAQPGTLTFDYIYEQLVNHELQLTHEHHSHKGPINAHHVHKRPTGSSKSSSFPSHNNHPSSSTHQKGKPKLDTCQWCNKKGHIACFCFKIANNPNIKHTAHAAIIPPCENHWLVDSGASHHITNDFGNLSIHTEYPGPNHLIIANGNHLPISHVGSTGLHSPLSSLQLSNVLYVPNID